MVQVDFSQKSYFPCLQCSDAEQMAYRHLSDEDKDAIFPIFEISQTRNEAALEEALNSISESAQNRPFILDLSHDRAPQAYVPQNNPDTVRVRQIQAAQDAYNAVMTGLLTPDDGFAAWRALCERFPNAIPVIRYTDPVAQANSILRQAFRLSLGGSQSLAIRVFPETGEEIFSIIGQILSILESPDRLLIILDCAQGRRDVSRRAEFARQAIARISEELEPALVPYITSVCVSDFFTTPPSAVGVRAYENSGWTLWGEVSEFYPVMFGDYAAHKRIRKTNTFVPGEWKAKTIFPLDESWLVYQDANSQDAEGWLRGAAAVCAHDEFDGFPDCWGGNMLQRASNGSIAGVESARFWEASKINMHIHRQISYARQMMNPE